MTKQLSKSSLERMGRFGTYFVLILCSAVCIIPFLWMVLTAFKSNVEAYTFPPTIFPNVWRFDNFTEGFAVADFPRFTFNTLIIAVSCTVSAVFSSAFVAYGFARFKAVGSKILYICLLGTMMLPGQVTLIPQYLLYANFGMIDTYWPLIIPSILGGGAYNIFLYCQFFKTLPKELNEAATIDGANSFQTFTRIMLPAVKPVSLAVGVMALVYNWNDFFTPLIYLNSTEKFTIAIGLQFLNSDLGDTKIGQMMAVAVTTMIPVLIVFFICQKYFVQGIKMSGLKA